ncbi:hypothetical protein VZO05_08775 [Aggregatilineales bacterium SYSU G02658]
MTPPTITKTVTVRSGKAELDLPDFPDGEVVVHVEAAHAPDRSSVSAWMRQAQAKSGAEVLHMIDSGVIDTSCWQQIEEDSASWVERLRRSPRTAD